MYDVSLIISHGRLSCQASKSQMYIFLILLLNYQISQDQIKKIDSSIGL
jgi:hypothetical protein